jgi:hypothetical protein
MSWKLNGSLEFTVSDTAVPLLLGEAAMCMVGMNINGNCLRAVSKLYHYDDVCKRT